ncbi:hypothetical protein, conserved, partial [Eimeria tenella]
MVTGGVSSGATQGDGSRQPLLSVKAGRCLLSGKLVSPDVRKGCLQLFQ